MLKRAAFLFILVFSLTQLVPFALADTGTSSKLAVMILMDRINLEDLTADYPNLRNLMNRAALALMNTRPAGNHDPASCYLTIGAGTRASASGKGKKALMAFEEYEFIDAGSAFKMFTGLSVPGNAIVELDIPEIIEKNKKQSHKVKPGLLGEILKNHGIAVSILGNADTILEKNRLAALIAMDANGVIYSGHVGEDLNIQDNNTPFFVKTDYKKLHTKFLELKEKGGLIVIYLGDTVRVNDIVNLVTPEMYENYRKKVLKDADEFIGRIVENLDPKKDLLMIVTPFPSYRGYQEKNLLTPFIAFGPNMKPGLAQSATTRRAGIISNIDIAPTVLSFFQIQAPVEMLGHPIESNSFIGAYDYLLKINRQAIFTYIQRPYLIKSYVVMQIVVLLVFLFFIYFKKRWLVFTKPFILASMTTLLVFLILPLLPGENLLSRFLWTFIITAAVVAIAIRAKNSLGSIAFICLLTASAVTADLLWGGRLLGSSVLGHDPIAGARYYGIGNEYMGVLVGSTTIGITAMMDKIRPMRHRISLALCFVAFVFSFYLISSPSFGSNVGGAVTAFGAYLTTLILLSGSKLTLKTLSSICIGIVLMLILLFLFAAVAGPPSHISQMIELVKADGIEPVLSTITRKLAMNYKLFRYTPWTRVLITTIAVMISLSFRPPNTMKKFLKSTTIFTLVFQAQALVQFLLLFLTTRE